MRLFAGPWCRCVLRILVSLHMAPHCVPYDCRCVYLGIVRIVYSRTAFSDLGLKLQGLWLPDCTVITICEYGRSGHGGLYPLNFVAISFRVDSKIQNELYLHHIQYIIVHVFL